MSQHEHDHPHAEIGQSERPGYYDMMETAVRELLIEKGLFEAGEIRRQIEVLDSRTPALGAKVVARAWVDADFRARLLANGRTACEELGISFYDDTKLKPYRARAVSEPRAVLAEFGTHIPDDVEVRVSDSTALVRYLVLPRRPDGTAGYSEEQLAGLVTRDAMIGVIPVTAGEAGVSR